MGKSLTSSLLGFEGYLVLVEFLCDLLRLLVVDGVRAACVDC